MIEDGFGNLGFYSMSILHLFITVGSFISTAILNKIGLKLCLFLGSLSMTLWAFSSIIAALKYNNPTSDAFYV